MNDSKEKSFAFITRLDPKTGLMREYKLYENPTSTRRVVVAAVDGNRDVTREVVRTEGQPWIVLQKKEGQLSVQTEHAVLQAINSKPMEDIRSSYTHKPPDVFPDSIRKFKRNLLEVSTQDIDEDDQADRAVIAIYGSIPTSWTIDAYADDFDSSNSDLEIPKENNFDAPLYVHLELRIHPILPDELTIRNEHELGFENARMTLLGGAYDLEVDEDFKQQYELTSGYINIHTGAITITKGVKVSDCDFDSPVIEDGYYAMDEILRLAKEKRNEVS